MNEYIPFNPMTLTF